MSPRFSEFDNDRGRSRNRKGIQYDEGDGFRNSKPKTKPKDRDMRNRSSKFELDEQGWIPENYDPELRDD